MACEKCGDAGYTVKIDIMKGRRVKEVCSLCHGIPEAQKLRPDGVRHCSLPYQIYLWQEFKNDKPISTLELWICPVMNGRVPAMVKDNPLKPPRPRIYVKIRDMNTKKKYRKQGKMTTLLLMATGDTKIEWFETSYRDSTESGRKLLFNTGFMREDDKIVYRHPEGASVN